jgi:hypothetical protein
MVIENGATELRGWQAREYTADVVTMPGGGTGNVKNMTEI